MGHMLPCLTDFIACSACGSHLSYYLKVTLWWKYRF